jgi:hypothetical protein
MTANVSINILSKQVINYLNENLYLDEACQQMKILVDHWYKEEWLLKFELHISLSGKGQKGNKNPNLVWVSSSYTYYYEIL